MKSENRHADRQLPLPREAFPYFTEIHPRWNDNDAYGHINNAVYYFYFDTIVNNFLIDASLLNIDKGEVIGLVAHTECDYFVPLKYPELIDVGLGVTKIGNSSITYKIGLFKKGADPSAALGKFVHVYVDSQTRKSVTLPNALRKHVETLKIV